MTLIVLDHHREAENARTYPQKCGASIAEACTRIGLPEPREVIVMHDSAHGGVPPASSFPQMRRKDGGECCHRYATLVFDRPVCGPLMLGVGRIRGYGVCRMVSG